MKSIAASIFLMTLAAATPLFAQTPTVQPAPAVQPATAQQPVTPMTTLQQVGVAQPEQGTRSLSTTELGTAALMVERAMKVLDEAANKKTGDVTLDRGLLDEVRAELAQVKATLEAGKK